MADIKVGKPDTTLTSPAHIRGSRAATSPAATMPCQATFPTERGRPSVPRASMPTRGTL